MVSTCKSLTLHYIFRHEWKSLAFLLYINIWYYILKLKIDAGYHSLLRIVLMLRKYFLLFLCVLDTLDDSTQTWISALMQKNTIFNYKILILSSNGHFKRLRKYRQNFLWHTLPSNRKLRNLLGSDKEIELGLSCSADQSETEFVFLLSRWTNRRPYSWTGF